MAAPRKKPAKRSVKRPVSKAAAKRASKPATKPAPVPPLDPRSLGGLLRARALSFPEATEDFPWGERAIKVRGKAFLFLRVDGGSTSFSVKLPESAADALELPGTEPTQYGLGKHGWVSTVVDGARDAPIATFEAWLEESYRAVAPKSLGAGGRRGA